MKVVKNQIVTEEEAKNLTFQEVSDLISKDPVTCMRHFDHKFRALLKYLIKPKEGVFAPNEVTEYFSRMEFQMRGSPHVHGLYWLKDAPVYEESDPESKKNCTIFIDNFITCERCEDGKMEELIGYQLHKHSQTCKKKAGILCRFGYPKPPLDETQILVPIAEGEISDELLYKSKQLFEKIQGKLNEWGRGFKEVIPYKEFLLLMGTTHEEYILSIRTSIKRAAVFLKRSTNAAFINPYNRNLLEAWEANMDIQFVLDTYACAKYCVSYIAKAEGGVSKALQAAAKDAKKGNPTVKEKLKKFANILINGSEISAQEAAAFILGIPNTICSRSEVFINTAPPAERIRMLKSKEDLESLADDSQDVTVKGLIDHYIQRPDKLVALTLAEVASNFEFCKQKTGKLLCSEENFDTGE